MSSSRSSQESGSSPAQTKKRRKVESLDGVDDQDASSDDEDTPQPLTPSGETVLSHAERRRQKKKQKQEQRATASSESTRKKRKLDDGTADTSSSNILTKTSAVDDPRRQRRQNSVWVGNLAFKTTQDGLRAFFDGVGKITRIHLPMRRGTQTQGENTGFAYVDFETPEAKVIAITLSEGQLDGRNLLIKDGDDFTGRPSKTKADTSDADRGGESEGSGKKSTVADGKGLSKTAQKILRTQKQPPAPTLFLGNLGFETTEESIRELFEAHRYWGRKDRTEEHETEGHADEDEKAKSKSKDVWIRKIRMGTFEDSGACKGFAFVDFTSIEHATAVLINPRNHRLNGRDLVVEYASPEAVRRGGGPRNVKGLEDPKSRSRPTKTRRKDSAAAPDTKKHHGRLEREDDADVATEVTLTRQFDRPGHDRPHTRRAKPGAALAHAQRQSAAILPSQGQKTVF